MDYYQNAQASRKNPGLRMSGDLLEEIVYHSLRKSYARNSPIYHQGDPADFIFLVERGMVKLLAYESDGKIFRRPPARPGNWLGLDGALFKPRFVFNR
ncbi:cyclic nucleotide-binding domain-containing protein [Candidatus Woesearchaeota archaeon]|nr:cyclic nucleotide-binding domain-containing protein [Candidatus Woesearchaeota archaeon]